MRREGIRLDQGLITALDWTRRSRAVLTNALERLGPERYRAPQATLAGDSIRDRHIHIAACYIYWAARIGLGEDVPEFEAADFPDAAASRTAFATADAAVERLLQRFDGRLDEPIERVVWGQKERLTPRWLIVHPITHEFSHKGQIVVVLRLFGLAPFDADMVRPLPPLA